MGDGMKITIETGKNKDTREIVSFDDIGRLMTKILQILDKENRDMMVE